MDMEIIHGQKLSTLIVKKYKGEATQTELMHLEEWASLSTGNWAFVKRFENREYVESMIEKLNKIDLPAMAADFQKRLIELEAKRSTFNKFRRNFLLRLGRMRVFLSRWYKGLRGQQYM